MSDPTQVPRPLDESAVGRWGTIASPALTGDGKRVVWLRAGFDGSRALHVRDLATGGETVVEEVEHFELAAGRLVYGGPHSDTLVVRDLASGDETSFAGVDEHVVSSDGTHLLLTETAETGVARLVDLATGKPLAVLEATGRVAAMALDAGGRSAAFYVERSDGDACDLYVWAAGESPASTPRELPGLPDGWNVVPAGPPGFSPSAKVLVVTAAPPQPAPSGPAVEIWRSDDPELPTERRCDLSGGLPAYRLALHLDHDKAVLLEDADLPDVDLDDADAPVFLGLARMRCRREAGWEDPAPVDYLAVNAHDGTRTTIRRAARGEMMLSPERRYALWWHALEADWHVTDLHTSESRSLTADLPVAFHDEDWDRPGPPDAYGAAGWWPGEHRVLLYDRYDLWELDPAGVAEARNLTAGAGRERKIRLRRADGGSGTIGQARPLLHGFEEATKSTGFYRLEPSTATLDTLLEADRELTLVATANEGAGARHLFTRSSVTEFPDLWVAGDDFRQAVRVTDANPQQADYRWATAELVEWTQPDGSPGCGVLYKPQDFDAGRRYPLVVFSYARFSDSLHHHFTPPPLPQPVINPLVYASGGYLVLVPDIRFRIGEPGASAFDAVTSGVRHLIDAGLVDETRVGGGSHSWGGWEMAYIATRTEMFRAIAAGAPVANMTSSYGEIRAQTGRSRMYEYEQAQSRIGKTLWEDRDAYLENSPIFAADRIRTPLLILHNDHDGAVPQSEGLQLFLALRRLGRPAWLVNYPGEGHLLSDPHYRMDWDRRLREFFDHHLAAGPEPKWMTGGAVAGRDPVS